MATVSDDFNRADAAIGANWTTVAGSTNNFTITSNQVGTSGTGEAAYHNGFSGAGGDIYGQITELNTPANSSIGIIFEQTDGHGYTVNRLFNGNLAFKRDGVTIGSGYTPGSFVAGILRVEKEGSVIRVKLDGAQIDTYTDGSPFAVTRVGMFCSTGDAALRADNFEGGDFVASGSVLDEDGEWIITTQNW